MVHSKIDILIPTLEARKESFEALTTKLRYFIGLHPINIVSELDNGEMSTGEKRNLLLQNSTAEYACFLDDDDDISDTYIQWLVKAANSGLDCASLGGIITFNGKGARPFIHSIQYDRYFEQGLLYCRPPNHLNLIRTDISKNFNFPHINLSEDTEWSMKLQQAGVLRTEFSIPEIMYYYKYYNK
jgi:glycosyltransferase involved in cell wall biosynthesis